jgi:hypothetical protein
MAGLIKLANRITGLVPEVDLDLAMWKMSEAITKIYDECDWAFQRSIVYANWLCAGQIGTNGSTTVTQGSPTVTLNTPATQQINGYVSQITAALLTTLQYRDPAYSIYNIVGATGLLGSGGDGTVSYVTTFTPGAAQTPGTYIVTVLDAGNTGSGGTLSITVQPNGTVTTAPTVLTAGSNYLQPYITFAEGGTPATFQVFQNIVLTLDRPWLEPTNGPGQSYMIYQAYFVAPVLDFHKFIEIRDTTNAAPIDFWTMTQAELAIRDPQRTEFTNPSYCVPAGFDYRANSSTYGYPMFELWPQQLDQLPYSFSYRRKGITGYATGVPESFLDFQTYPLPQPITHQLVEQATLVKLYEYKEAQKDKSAARGSGANWLLLIQTAQKRYEESLDKLIAIDLNLNGEAFTRLPGRAIPINNVPYSNQLGGLNVGSYPETSD